MKTKIARTVWDQYKRDPERKMERDRIVCADFKELKKAFPKAKITTLCNSLAYKYFMEDKPKIFPKSSVGINDILVRNGLYSRRKQKNRKQITDTKQRI